MLIEFSVENFRSIKEKQTLSMLSAGKVNEHPDNVAEWGNLKLTKSAIIYGRNASGKSNLLRALDTFREFVRNSDNIKLGDKISFYNSFKLDSGWISKPTTFSIDFIATDNVRYQYLISYIKEEVVEESLYYYPNKQRVKLFLRTKDRHIDFGTSLKGNKKTIENQLLRNQLFLPEGANRNLEQLKTPYLYFKGVDLIFHLTHDSVLDEVTTGMLSSFVGENSNIAFRNNMEKLLSVSDTGIWSFEINEASPKNLKFIQMLPPDEKNDYLNDFKYEIKTIHKIQDPKNNIEHIAFNLKDESTGTVKLFHVGGLCLIALSLGRGILIDELDKSLHPLLTRTLIKLFHNPKTNPKNAQLIFATHDISLLDNELFRRDQIWFTEKESDGATKVYSLSDFNGVRKDIPYDKWYMSGRFGAIPSINESELNLEF